MLPTGFARLPNGKNPIDPPPAISRDILSLPKWDFPPLRRIATVPYFSRTVRLIATPGYDRHEGVLLHLPAKLVIGDVPERPSDADVTARSGSFSRSSLETFRFRATRTERMHWRRFSTRSFVRVSRLAAAACMWSMPRTPGTGKGLLAQAVVLLSTGADPGVVSEKERQRRASGSHYRPSCSRGASAVVIEQRLTRKLGTGVGSAAAAQRLGRGAIASSEVEGGGGAQPDALDRDREQYAAMNDEMARRSVQYPASTQASKSRGISQELQDHDPLLDWVEGHRGELVWAAACVLAANWLARGATRPSVREDAGVGKLRGCGARVIERGAPRCWDRRLPSGSATDAQRGGS